MPLPSTSHEANALMTAEIKQEHHAKIIAALEVLVEDIGEKIAVQANMDYHAVMRRMKELVDAGKIYNTLKTGITTTGRKANKYAIRKPETILPTPEHHYKEGETTGADIACMIINKHEKLKQKSLFE